MTPIPLVAACIAAAALLLPALPAQTRAAEAQRLLPEDFRYLGAFRLPAGGARPKTFAYGGNAMTFNPDGDRSGPRDGFPGSLFVMGHDRLAYGELPNGNQVAEVNIPKPVKSTDLTALSRAQFLQPFRDVAKGQFRNMAEIPTVGLEYLNTPATGAKIHIGWGQHYAPERGGGTHGWFDPNLAQPDFQGTWSIGNRSFYSVNGFLFAIPTAWAEQHAGGRSLATGRFRDGGWSGMGPALFAYRPWIDDAGTPAPPGTRLAETALLLYQSSENTDQIERCLNGYQHPDEWEGGAWITTKSGKSAVLFAGTKGTGRKYWYGFINPAGANLPCVHAAAAEWVNPCIKRNGKPCPPQDLVECAGHDDNRGWWSARFDAQFILYDPADLARVAAGELQTWQPQPYAALDVDKHLYLTSDPDVDQLAGWGVQRKHRLGAVAFDRAHGLLYVIEPYADAAAPVVHVWKLR